MTDVKPITLDDLMPAQITITIRHPRYDRVLEIPIVTLSWEEWDSIGREIVDPEIPYTALAEDGKTKLPNPADKRYVAQIQDNALERSLRRIFACLERAGNAFPGDTAREKYENLKKADYGMVEALIRAVMEANQAGRSELQTLAASFRAQPLPSHDDANSNSERLDEITMVKPA